MKHRPIHLVRLMALVTALFFLAAVPLWLWRWEAGAVAVGVGAFYALLTWLAAREVRRQQRRARLAARKDRRLLSDLGYLEAWSASPHVASIDADGTRRLRVLPSSAELVRGWEAGER